MAKNRSVSNYLSASTAPSLESFEMTMLGAASNTKRKLLKSLVEYIEEQVRARLAGSTRNRLTSAEIPRRLFRIQPTKTLAPVQSANPLHILPSVETSLPDFSVSTLSSPSTAPAWIMPCLSNRKDSSQCPPSNNLLCFRTRAARSARGSSSIRLNGERSSPDEPPLSRRSLHLARRLVA